MESYDLKQSDIKRTIRKLLPEAAYRRATTLWHLRGHLTWVFKNFLKNGCPETLLHFGIAPGDDLLCTAVLRELTKRGQKNLWMMSNYPELFEGNTDVSQVVPVEHKYRFYADLCSAKYHSMEYAPVDLEKDASVPPKRHILAELASRAGVEGQIALRPYFYLTAAEKEKGAWAEGQVAIQSSGLGGVLQMKNKQWYPERFQDVINHLNGGLKFIQIGSTSDPALAGVTDLRGKTSIREAAALLANSRLYLGNVGFLMHLARAVECPSVVIFGGREAPWQSGYTCNINLYSAVPCAPCWLWNKCDYDRMCMKNITTADVINAVEQMIKRPRNPLSEELAKI
jgi:hypothetical protein